MSLVLGFDEWPAADCAMWHQLVQPVGPLDDGGQLAHLRQTSRKTLQAHYGRWLKWLADTDPAALSETPTTRATIDRLQDWLCDLSHTRPMSQWSFVGDAVRLLRAAAPDSDWRDQKRLVKHLRRQAGQGDRTRKAGRVLDSGVLLDAGIRLATSGACAATTPLQTLKRQRDGTMIAFWALLPIRRRAFAGLSIDDSIHILPESIEITLPEELTKTGVPWEVRVPECILLLMRNYWKNVRPQLMARGGKAHDFFWVGDWGAPYQPDNLGNRIGNITEQITGVRVTPHLFRDAAATTLSRHSPDAARLIPPVLSHTSNLTSQKHYIHAGSIEAGRGLAEVVRKRKRGVL